mgnify:FL=1
MLKDVYEFQVVIKGAVNIRDVTTLGKHDIYAFIQYENYSYKLSTHHSYSTNPSKLSVVVVMM